MIDPITQAWIARVQQGDFNAIPAPLTWKKSAELAHLINGYEIAGGFETLLAICNRTRQQLHGERGGHPTALDLWLSLFATHRAYRHGGFPPGEDELPDLNQLCERLRRALCRLGPKQRAGILSVMDGY